SYPFTSCQYAKKHYKYTGKKGCKYIPNHLCHPFLLFKIDIVVSRSSDLGINFSVSISGIIFSIKSCTEFKWSNCMIVSRDISYISKNKGSGLRFCISPNVSYNKSILSATDRI